MPRRYAGTILADLAMSDSVLRQGRSAAGNAASYPLRRRVVLRRIGAGIAVALAAACSPALSTTSAPSRVAPTETSATPASTSPRRGGTLRMGISGDLARLDGHLLLGYLVDTLWNVYDRLTSYDEQ